MKFNNVEIKEGDFWLRAGRLWHISRVNDYGVTGDLYFSQGPKQSTVPRTILENLEPTGFSGFECAQLRVEFIGNETWSYRVGERHLPVAGVKFSRLVDGNAVVLLRSREDVCIPIPAPHLAEGRAQRPEPASPASAPRGAACGGMVDCSAAHGMLDSSAVQVKLPALTGSLGQIKTDTTVFPEPFSFAVHVPPGPSMSKEQRRETKMLIAELSMGIQAQIHWAEQVQDWATNAKLTQRQLLDRIENLERALL